VHIDKIKPHPANPNDGDVATIAEPILLADNRTAEKAEREPEPLAGLLQELEQADDWHPGARVA